MKPGMLMMVIFIVSILLTGCNGNTSQNDITGNSVTSMSVNQRAINIDKLEIYHFHGTDQCYSCKTVGAYAEETVNTYFKEELKSGKIVFGHINIDLLENRELVLKYGATGSSLWLGTYNKDKFNAEENVNVWYKIRNKKAYMDYLKEIIEKKLKGN